jgi:hypothetical protein
LDSARILVLHGLHVGPDCCCIACRHPLQGRAIERLSTMVVNQLKKSIRTKHTLPAFKNRLVITDLDMRKRELLHKEMGKGREPKAVVAVCATLRPTGTVLSCVVGSGDS